MDEFDGMTENPGTVDPGEVSVGPGIAVEEEGTRATRQLAGMERTLTGSDGEKGPGRSPEVPSSSFYVSVLEVMGGNLDAAKAAVAWIKEEMK